VSARRALLLAALAVAVAPAPALAVDVSAAELRELAARAPDDAAALRRLRQVDAVDGRPADVAGSLANASAEELAARLRALAASGEGADAAGARADAAEILSERRFRDSRFEGPFRGLLRRIGRLADPIRDFFDGADATIPGPQGVVWAILIAIVGGLTWLIAGRTARRRAALAGAAARDAGPRGESPAALERRAAEAERRGDHELALRLRFRAGLLRLEVRPSLPSVEVSRRLRSEDFDRLAADFDSVVYGGRAADAGDVEAARRGWDRVLETRR
jgi:hypothetical protein